MQTDTPPPPSPEELLRFADAYAAAAVQLRGVAFTNMDFVTVGVVFDAFAAELYLKGLYLATKRQLWPERVHNLSTLYRKLSHDLQAKVAAGWAAVLNQDRSGAIARTVAMGATPEHAEQLHPHRMPEDFAPDLAKGANAFVDWRYVFENNPTTAATIGPAFPVLRQLILDHLTVDEHRAPQAAIVGNHPAGFPPMPITLS